MIQLKHLTKTHQSSSIIINPYINPIIFIHFPCLHHVAPHLQGFGKPCPQHEERAQLRTDGLGVYGFGPWSRGAILGLDQWLAFYGWFLLLLLLLLLLVVVGSYMLEIPLNRWLTDVDRCKGFQTRYRLLSNSLISGISSLSATTRVRRLEFLVIPSDIDELFNVLHHSCML